MSEGRADIVDRLAKLGRLRQKIGGEIRALRHALPQPVSLFDRQGFRVPQPLDDVLGLAKGVLMRGKAVAGLWGKRSKSKSATTFPTPNRACRSRTSSSAMASSSWSDTSTPA